MNITEQEIKDLKEVRSYFGEHDKTLFEHKAYAILDNIVKKLTIQPVISWVAFDFYKLETRPPKYGKYLITRKDGKIHWETWNGNGWAYNHNEIRYWAEIKPPCL